MAYVATARGWWRFNQSLSEEISTSDFQTSPGVVPEYQPFRLFDINSNENLTQNGLILKSGETYSAEIGGFVTSGVYSLAMSMWYHNSKAVGQTRHATTRDTTPLEAPIVAKANSLVSNGDESITSGEWILSEIGYSKNQNAIQLYVCDSSNSPRYVYTSEPYNPGLIHIFVTMIYSSTSTYARIDINGKFGEQNSSLVYLGSPISTVAPIRINDIGFGPTAHKTYPQGRYISDLVLKQNGQTNSDQTVNVFRFGPNAILDSDADSRRTSFLGIGSSQPETITTNQIYSEGGHVFVTRSNGEILEGHKPIWANDLNFSSESSLAYLKISKTGSSPEWTPDGLKIQGTTIRI